MADSISGDNWEVGKTLRFFCLFVCLFVCLFLCLLRGVSIMFDNNCWQCSWYWLYSTNERGKILNYKWLRQAGLIIPKRDFISGACLWIPNLKFLCWVMFTVRYFSNQDIEDAFNLTYLMEYWESNPIQPCFLRRYMVYLYAIQSTWWKCRI